MVIAQDFSQCVKECINLEGRPAATSARECHLGFGIDDSFARPLGVLLTSLCEHNQQLALTFHVMALALDEQHVQRLREIAQRYHVNICIYYLNADYFTGLLIQRNWPLPIYFRFILPKLLHAQTLLYLDSDILCLRSIQPLLDIPLGECVLAAVPDAENTATRRKAALGIATYFNSGVLLISMENWNRAAISERALTMLFETPDKFTYPDQDVLNVLLQGKTIVLDNAWNCLFDDRGDEASAQQAWQQAALLHLAARPKPWMVAYDCPFMQQRYLEYEQRSPWANLPLLPPRAYYEMRFYAENLWRKHQYQASVAWYLRYLLVKTRQKMVKR